MKLLDASVSAASWNFCGGRMPCDKSFVIWFLLISARILMIAHFQRLFFPFRFMRTVPDYDAVRKEVAGIMLGGFVFAFDLYA